LKPWLSQRAHRVGELSWGGAGGEGAGRGRDGLAFYIAPLRPAARGLVAGPAHLRRADGCSPAGKGLFPGAALALRHRSLELV